MTVPSSTRPAAAAVPARSDAPPPARHRPPITAQLFGGAAVLGGSSALVPLLDGAAWWQPVAITIAIITLIGVGASLVGIPGWAAVIAQLAALPLIWTALFLPSGLWGLFPGPTSLREADGLLAAAWEQIVTTPAPAPATVELTFLLAVAIGMTALLVDLLISAARLPAMTAIPLLALYSVPASIAPDLLPWYAFVLPLAGYAAVLAASSDMSHRLRIASMGSAITITALAVGGALLITAASGWIGTDGRIPHSGRAPSDVALSPWALLRGELLSDDPVDVISVSGSPREAYLRTFVLQRWVPDEGFALEPPHADLTDVDGLLPNTAAPADTGTVEVTPLRFRDRYLPIYPGSIEVEGLGAGWNYDAFQDTVFRNDPVVADPYTVAVPTTVAAADSLRQDRAADLSSELTDTTGVTAHTAQLARSIVAGASTDFDKVARLLDFFTKPENGFRYSLATEAGSSGNALADFLTERTGYCEQYAAAMAVMVRAVGIPARVGIGFTEGAAQPDGTSLISSDNAHAWVEVPFADAGWITFDPTPPVNGQGGIQGFDATAASPGEPAASAAPTTTSAAPPTSTRPAPAPMAGPQIPDLAAPPGGADSTVTPSPILAHLWTILIVAAAALILMLAATGPRLLRRRQRGRRLREATGRGSPVTAWAEIMATARDHDVTPTPDQTLRDQANVVAHRARLAAADRSLLRDTVLAVERTWYGKPDDPGVTDDTDHGAAARAVIDGLERSSQRTWLERWWPRSVRPRRRG